MDREDWSPEDALPKISDAGWFGVTSTRPNARRAPRMKKLSVALTSCVLAACVATSSRAATARTGQVVMGTVLEVAVVADDPVVARTMADRAVAIARRWDNVLTIWRPDGELAMLNVQAGNGFLEISPRLHLALALMRSLAIDTGGAFNPAVGALVARYSSPSGAPRGPEPTRKITEVLTLEAARAAIAAGTVLDSGGIGKGIALDAIATELVRTGVRGVFLDFGGSSQLALGRSETGEPWRVAIAGLRPGEVLGTVELDGALSTSRSRPAGDPSGPIVDPRSGMLVTEDRLATCWAASAAVADAWSTALIVLGPRALAASTQREVAALVETADGTTTLSPGFARRLRTIESRTIP
jgi:thiamine biosynthesis lipoprotein